MARRRRCAIANPRRRRAWRGGAIAIEDLVFAYPGTSVDVLRGVDLEIAAGETLALVGPSGAGKTTLDQLLLRFFDPARGRLAPARAGLRCGDGGAFRIARGHRLGRRCRGPC